MMESNKKQNVVTTVDGGYGWVIVVVCFLSNAIGDSFIYTYGALYSDLVDLYDESISNVIIGGFMMLGFANAVGPLGSALVHKFGYKAVMVFGATTSSIAISSCSAINSLLWFNIVMGFIGGSTQGLLLLGSYTMTSLWFEKKRPIACSIAFSGVGFGCIIYPILIDCLISVYSIRGCLLIIGAINLNLVPISLLVKEPCFTDKIESGSNEIAKEDLKEHDCTNGPCLSLLHRFFQPQLFTNIPFWIILGSAFHITIILFAIPQTIRNYTNVIGFTRSQSSMFTVTFGAVNITMKIAIGITVRYIKRSKLVYIVSGVILAIATSLVGLIPTYSYILVYAFILASTSSNIVTMRYLIMADYIPKKYLTSAYGWTFLIQSASLIPALFIAEIGTEHGNYALSFIVNGVIALVGSGLMSLLYVAASEL